MSSVNPVYRSMSAIIAASLFTSIVAYSADTRIAVLEFGKGGVVRRTQSNPAYSSVKAVQSFWSVLHDGEKKNDRTALQYPGMTMVPDIFNRANGGLIIKATGDLNFGEMDPLKSVIAESVIGDFFLSGSVKDELVQTDGTCTDETLELAVKKVMAGEAGNVIEKLSTSDVPETNRLLSKLLLQVKQDAEAKGTTVIVHLVMDVKKLDVSDHGDTVEMHRRLEAVQDGDANSIFYGYSYKLPNGETYTPWKTISQIQTSNVFLWTAIGLFLVLYVALYKFASMRLIPDTLLFGEAGKAMGD